MLKEKSKRGLGKKKPSFLLRTFVGLEILAFAGSYLLWSRMNNDINFRYYLHETYPSILAGFYKSSEILSGEEALKKIRESDSAIFAAQNQSKNV